MNNVPWYKMGGDRLVQFSRSRTELCGERQFANARVKEEEISSEETMSLFLSTVSPSPPLTPSISPLSLAPRECTGRLPSFGYGSLSIRRRQFGSLRCRSQRDSKPRFERLFSNLNQVTLKREPGRIQPNRYAKIEP